MTTEFTENGVKDKIGYVLSLVGAGGTFYFTYFITTSLALSPARGISALVGFGTSAFLAKKAADNPNGRLINMAENLLTVESTFLSIVAGFKVLMGGVNKSTLTICAVPIIGFSAIALRKIGCSLQNQGNDLSEYFAEKCRVKGKIGYALSFIGAEIAFLFSSFVVVAPSFLLLCKREVNPIFIVLAGLAGSTYLAKKSAKDRGITIIVAEVGVALTSMGCTALVNGFGEGVNNSDALTLGAISIIGFSSIAAYEIGLLLQDNPWQNTQRENER